MATALAISVPQDYGYVLSTATAFYALLFWLAGRSGSYRRAAKVPHPNVYASAETIANASSAQQKQALYLFNCAQRAHHNVLENYTAVLTGMLISGLWYPLFAAGAGAVWIIGRVIYAVGYTSTSERNVNGRGRLAYGGFYVAALCQLALMLLVGKIGLQSLWN